MITPPSNPIEMKDRVFANLLADICDISSGKSRKFQRVDALRGLVGKDLALLTGSHPSGHASFAVDGASRVDPGERESQ